jgi:hypothetical protein
MAIHESLTCVAMRRIRDEKGKGNEPCVKPSEAFCTIAVCAAAGQG